MANKQRNVLGRGLEALIPTGESEAKSEVEVGIVRIPVGSISPNPHQPRQEMDPESLAELVASIRTHGVLQPLVVTQVGDTYQIIAGERRWRASQLAELDTVPVVIKETTPQQMLELALVENIQRADLNPLEEANAFRQLMDDFGLTQEEVAERVGKSRTAVANTVRLLRLPAQVKDALAAGLVSEGHARSLLSLPETEQQLQVLDEILKRSLNVRQTESLVRNLQELPKRPPADKDVPPLSVQDQHVVDQFQERLGTKVNLMRSKKGGRLVIHFFSDEELNAIYEAILDKEQ